MRSSTLFRVMARDRRTDYGFAWIRGLNIRVSRAYVPVPRDVRIISERIHAFNDSQVERCPTRQRQRDPALHRLVGGM